MSSLSELLSLGRGDEPAIKIRKLRPEEPMPSMNEEQLEIIQAFTEARQEEWLEHIEWRKAKERHEHRLAVNQASEIAQAVIFEGREVELYHRNQRRRNCGGSSASSSSGDENEDSMMPTRSCRDDGGGGGDPVVVGSSGSENSRSSSRSSSASSSSSRARSRSDAGTAPRSASQHGEVVRAEAHICDNCLHAGENVQVKEFSTAPAAKSVLGVVASTDPGYSTSFDNCNTAADVLDCLGMVTGTTSSSVSIHLDSNLAAPAQAEAATEPETVTDCVVAKDAGA